MGKPRTPKGRAGEVGRRLAAQFPGDAVALCELHHRNPFELLVATILSAQCTDQRVNEVAPQVFARWPDAAALAAADQAELEEVIRSTGFFRAKANSLLGMARAVEERFGGVVPSAMDDLVTLPGVGRKTANVVRSVALGEPGLPVDTHVLRLSERLGLLVDPAVAGDAVKVEHALNAIVAPAERGVFSLRVILHGRRVCAARKPRCGDCVLADLCPSAFRC